MEDRRFLPLAMWLLVTMLMTGNLRWKLWVGSEMKGKFSRLTGHVFFLGF